MCYRSPWQGRFFSLGRSVVAWGVLCGCCLGTETPKLAQTDQANRLTYLDDFVNPYYPHLDFPQLITPQWVGEEGVEAVVILSIDDMRDTGRYENYLRPILDRLPGDDNIVRPGVFLERLSQHADRGIVVEIGRELQDRPNGHIDVHWCRVLDA